MERLDTEGVIPGFINPLYSHLSSGLVISLSLNKNGPHQTSLNLAEKTESFDIEVHLLKSVEHDMSDNHSLEILISGRQEIFVFFIADGLVNDIIMELINAYDLYKLEQVDELLETGLQSLDALFGGGISPSTFLEIVGLSATGKSQFCMQLAKNEKKKDSVYVDTEGGFHTKRVCDIAKNLLKAVEPLESLKHIRVSRCRDLVELTSAIHRLELLVQQNPGKNDSLDIIGLVIVDSVAMPLRGENDSALRSRLEISRILSKLAASYRLILRRIFPRSHRPSTRLWLCPPDTNSRNSWIFLTKSPSAKNGSIPFKITEGGLVEIEHDILRFRGGD
ncbi:hypothetical protein X798_04520 [Onchocerca flexuosa]|uniref:DNA repair protein RAD51 homolog 3 n=1 Tax=Onchocerca flexuosa TaxID=387005 RepID=A0A238BSX7_9BILA|nr:hypothetical protein X798_04520 [Onchocerca flexuosa]